jgi:putative SOS response-associated peptidase YedK
MCNLYSIKTKRADLARKFALSDNRMAAFDELSAIFPGHDAPVIKRTEDGARELLLRSWGFVLLREGYAPKRVTNARDDKVRTKFWKESFEKRRCLVPATAFCEPDEGRPARWHWFALKGDDPLFAFPGLYRPWKGPVRKGGPNVDIEVFAFLTTLPNALTVTINQERSPVLLTDEAQFAAWLTGTPEEAFALLQVSDPEQMHIVQSGFEREYLGPGAGGRAPAANGPVRAPASRSAEQMSFFDET